MFILPALLYTFSVSNCDTHAVHIYFLWGTMKRVILSAVLLSGVLLADGAKNVDRVQTMQNMETAMATIQKGFLYNNRNIIANGVQKLKYNTKNINSFKIADIRHDQFKEKDFAKTEAKAISTLADTILDDFDSGNKEKVLDTYRKMQNQCITCHRIVRKW